MPTNPQVLKLPFNQFRLILTPPGMEIILAFAKSIRGKFVGMYQAISS